MTLTNSPAFGSFNQLMEVGVPGVKPPHAPSRVEVELKIGVDLVLILYHPMVVVTVLEKPTSKTHAMKQTAQVVNELFPLHRGYLEKKYCHICNKHLRYCL